MLLLRGFTRWLRLNLSWRIGGGGNRGALVGLGCEWVDLPGDWVGFRPGVRGFVEVGSQLNKLIKMTVKRPEGKGFTAYFETVKDVRNFNDLIETIIRNAKKVEAGGQLKCPYEKCIGVENCIIYQEEFAIPRLEKEMEEEMEKESSK